MADLTVTPANVLASENAQTVDGIAGATIVAGQTLYIDTANEGKLKLADSDGASPVFVFAGISLHGASNGQPLKYVVRDTSFTPGFTASGGDDVWLSDIPGGMTGTKADLEAGDKVTHLGVMVTGTTLNLMPCVGGTIV